MLLLHTQPERRASRRRRTLPFSSEIPVDRAARALLTDACGPLDGGGDLGHALTRVETALELR